MKRVMQVVQVVAVRRRGRPRVGDCRVEFVVPRFVLDQLVREEQAGNGYRTRVAARVLCEWAGTTAPDYRQQQQVHTA